MLTFIPLNGLTKTPYNLLVKDEQILFCGILDLRFSVLLDLPGT